MNRGDPFTPFGKVDDFGGRGHLLDTLWCVEPPKLAANSTELAHIRLACRVIDEALDSQF